LARKAAFKSFLFVSVPKNPGWIAQTATSEKERGRTERITRLMPAPRLLKWGVLFAILWLPPIAHAQSAWQGGDPVAATNWDDALN
jgi:hypothetical protein